MNFYKLLLTVLCCQPMAGAYADTPHEFLNRFEAEARSAAPGFAASAVRGEQFFRHAGDKDWRCSSCHTDNPAALGKHITTNKPIDPLAPAANAERFSSPKKVEKWFRRNCNDVIYRECTSAEKADFLAYLITVKK